MLETIAVSLSGSGIWVKSLATGKLLAIPTVIYGILAGLMTSAMILTCAMLAWLAWNGKLGERD